MRILQVCKKFPYPLKDGETIAIYALSDSFYRLGHQVDILAMNTSRHYFNPDDLPPEYRKKFRVYQVEVDTRVKKLPALLNLATSSSYHIARFDHQKFHQKMKEVLRENNYDIIQLEGLYLTPYLKTIRKYADSPVVMRAHNVEHLIWEQMTRNESSFLKHKYLKLLAGRLKNYEISHLNDFDALIPISSKDEELFVKSGAKLPVKTVEAGMDMENLYPDNSGVEFPSVFYLGSLDWMPNVEGLKWFLEEVWPKILSSSKDKKLKFYIAGRNAPDWLKKYNQENVVIVGEVEDAVWFYQSKAIMVVPLLSGSGMKVKILEALALQKTIIATPVALEGIPCENGKHLLVARDAEEFAAMVQKCLKNITLYQSLGVSGCEWVRQHFSHITLGEKLIEFYKDKLL